LGKGSFGVVFLVMKIESIQEFAMKIIQIQSDKETKMSALETMEYMKKKNDITASLKNESIIKFHETIVLPEFTMIAVVMDYAEKCLSDILKKKIPETEAQNYILQLCEGVRYLHEELFVIHRDLKPKNILIKGDHIKICDFDTAKQKKGKDKNTEITFIITTPKYSAPEVINGNSQINEKVDIWSLGIIIHQILTGIHPFGSDNTKEMMLKGHYKLHASITDKKMIEILHGCFKVKPKERINIRDINILLGIQKEELNDDTVVQSQKLSKCKTAKINDPKENEEEEKNKENGGLSELRKIDFNEFEMTEEILIGFQIHYRVFDKINQRFYTIYTIYRAKYKNDANYEFWMNRYYLAFKIFKKFLNHKNIFQWEEMFLDDHQNYKLVFEDTSKIGLIDLVEHKRKKNWGNNKYSENQIVSIFLGIFECFAKAKEHGIFHGFINSSRFMFVQDEESHNFLLKITGFQVSLSNQIKKVQEDEMMSTNEIDFEDINKKYSAPELYSTKPKYNPYQADIFSLGIILLEMMGLTNYNLRLMRRQRFKNFNPYLALDYPHLLPIVKKMLKADPDQRITCQEIYNQLMTFEKNPTEEFEMMMNIQELIDTNVSQEEEEGIKVSEIYDKITDQKKGTLEKCGKNHDLIWSKAQEAYEEENFACEKCKKKTFVKNGRWFCEKCDFNICPRCRKVPLEKTKTCNADHPLIWDSKFQFNDRRYICDLCRKNLCDELQGRWHCDACDYDLCHDCRGPDQIMLE